MSEMPLSPSCSPSGSGTPPDRAIGNPAAIAGFVRSLIAPFPILFNGYSGAGTGLAIVRLGARDRLLRYRPPLSLTKKGQPHREATLLGPLALLRP